jgi:hypothetical protein
MGFYRIAELMEPWVALPDRSEAWFAVARAGSEATELGQVTHHLAPCGRSLRRGAVLRPRITGVPRPGCTHEVAGPIGIGASRPGDAGDSPGHHESARHGVQPPLIRLQGSRRHLTAVLEHPAQAVSGPPTPRPLHHRTGTGKIRYGQAREPAPCDRLLAARWAALLGVDRHDRNRGEPASRPAGASDGHPRDRDPEGDRSRRPVGLPSPLCQPLRVPRLIELARPPLGLHPMAHRCPPPRGNCVRMVAARSTFSPRCVMVSAQR